MDRSSVLRWVVIAGAILLFWQFGMPLITGSSDKVQSLPDESYANAPGFVPDVLDPPASPERPNAPPEGETCKIQGNRFDAMLSSRGAGITHLYLREAHYAGPDGFDLSTTPDHERWRSLRTLFRGPDATSQVKYDRFLWKLERDPQDKGCTFRYDDDDVRITKVVTAGARPFELFIETSVENLAKEPKRHQLSIATYAYRTNAEVKGSLGRVSPFQSELACAGGKDVVRKAKDEFKSGWFAVPSVDRYAAVNTHYFSQALIPQPDGTELPRCEILAEDWVSAGQSRDDERAGAIYHAKLVYPAKELAPGASAKYRQIGFFGPKEREVLANAAGGDKLRDVINLGFFTPVARVLVGVLVFFHDKITFENWGAAIILMTICLRLLLFPLTLKSIKTTIAMRRLKPEVDALNAKFADDPQAKNLAMMELWKKHGVNPFGGCLPQLVQMPVWFAMYTTLQTAVEMYHTKFLWFSDLSAPDKYYVMPLLLGAFMILQQRIVPQQGMDPMQQKMMTWMLPIVFTVMMLFLPAALGVYMLTNSVLGIAQQLIVEQVAPQGGKGKKGDIVVKQKDDKPKGKAALAEGLGKGKARV
jgi:YidC/Oxa1 family membrane protein insertase